MPSSPQGPSGVRATAMSWLEVLDQRSPRDSRCAEIVMPSALEVARAPWHVAFLLINLRAS